MGISFKKVMTKTYLSYNTINTGNMRPAGGPLPTIEASKIPKNMGDVWFHFRRNFFFEKNNQDLKNGQERRATQFSTICATDLALN